MVKQCSLQEIRVIFLPYFPTFNCATLFQPNINKGSEIRVWAKQKWLPIPGCISGPILSPEPLPRDTPAARGSPDTEVTALVIKLLLLGHGLYQERQGPTPVWPCWLSLKCHHSLGLCLFNACPTHHIQHCGLAHKEFSPLRIFLNRLWNISCFPNEPCPCCAPCGIQGCVCSSSIAVAPFSSSLHWHDPWGHLPSFLLMKTHVQFTIRLLLL